MPRKMKSIPKKSQKALLLAIFKRAGGLQTVANLLKCKRQTPHYWAMLMGYVPLNKLGNTATKLGVSPWALNYEGLAEILPDDAPSFPKIVKSFNFPSSFEKEVLNLYASEQT